MLGFKRSMVQAVIVLTWALNYYTFGNIYLWYFFTILLGLAIILSISTYDHDYWALRGIYSPPGVPIVGHILPVVTFKEQGGLCYKKIYDENKKLRFLGTHQFFTRTLVIRDPELIKRMCVNDFHHFTDRGFFFNKEVDPLAGSVLYLRGSEWKRLRAKISPIFSPNKLRGMFPLIDNTASEFVLHVKDVVTKTDEKNIKNNINNTSNGHVNVNTEHNGDTIDNLRNGLQINGVNKNNGINGLGTKRRENFTNGLIKENTNNIENGVAKSDNSFKKVNGVAKNGINSNEAQNGKLINNLNNNTENNKDFTEGISAVVDSEKLVGGYTADAIVPCAFGLKSGVMYNEKDPFAVALQAFYEMTVYNIFEKTMQQFWPVFALFFRMRIIPKKTHDFFTNIVTTVLRAREKGEQHKRGDFIDMMMALRNEDNNNNKVDENDVEITDMVISANAFIIFLGGFETTSSTLAFLCLELAAHPEVQEKMRQEIQDVLQRRGDITYEMLQELTYMEMVIQETLRLYPPFPTIQRECTRDYTIPGTSTVVERGTIVLFPTIGIQRDEQYFYKAESFIPERWSARAQPPAPGVYMPFGDGPRYCIGKRFAMIQMKCCLVRVLRHVRISSAHRTHRATPFPADARSPLTLHPADSLVRLTLL